MFNKINIWTWYLLLLFIIKWKIKNYNWSQHTLYPLQPMGKPKLTNRNLFTSKHVEHMVWPQPNKKKKKVRKQIIVPLKTQEQLIYQISLFSIRNIQTVVLLIKLQRILLLSFRRKRHLISLNEENKLLVHEGCKFYQQRA